VGMTPRSQLTLRPGTTDSTVVREIWDENVYHLSPECFLESAVAVDVGANIGAFALRAAELGARRIVAFEPELDNFRTLLSNLESNPFAKTVVEPVHAAIWRDDGWLSTVGTGGGAKVTTVDGGRDNRVRCLTLDRVFEENAIGECGFLKLDAEGAEYAILGAASTQTLNRCRRIALEFHAASTEVFGRFIAALTRTHKFYVLGSVDRGGYVWAERY
jgi:FkbM family methyltransferase